MVEIEKLPEMDWAKTAPPRPAIKPEVKTPM